MINQSIVPEIDTPGNRDRSAKTSETEGGQALGGMRLGGREKSANHQIGGIGELTALSPYENGTGAQTG